MSSFSRESVSSGELIAELAARAPAEGGNQGAWPFMALNLPQRLAELEPSRNWRLTKVARPESSAPSVGSATVHLQQQRALMEALTFNGSS